MSNALRGEHVNHSGRSGAGKKKDLLILLLIVVSRTGTTFDDLLNRYLHTKKNVHQFFFAAGLEGGPHCVAQRRVGRGTAGGVAGW